MGKRSQYEPGTFCWTDLQTTDAEAAKSFYGGLFGWTADDMPVGDGTVYTMFALDGDEVAAMNEMNAEQREAGVPPHWFSYVSVEDAVETASKVDELGGTVFGGAFDVLDAGRMAIIQDPLGATFAAWEPGDHIGASRVNDAGCLSFNQLNTSDPERAAAFYRGLFEWDVRREVEDPPYWGIDNKGSLNAGMMNLPEDAPDASSHWLVYFTTGDLDGSTADIEGLGGRTVLPPTEIPPEGRIGVFTDPQGAAFALFEGRTDE